MSEETHDVVIIGAGQGGLCLSHELTLAGREHIILERGGIGQSWRKRWDSFCLVLPNWTVKLCGRPYEGSDPDGFMPRDDIVRYLEDYARSFDAPVREGVVVDNLEGGSGGFMLGTSDATIRAREVVIASGGYQKPHRPAGVEELANEIPVMDAEEYRRPESIPSGKVLVVGSGQTGYQISEELSNAGREVYLSCGRAGWLPRRVAERDIIAWLEGTSFWNVTLADLPSPGARLLANPQMSGCDGGHDLNFRTLQEIGVTLAGHLAGVKDGVIRFAPDLEESVAFGDARYSDACSLVRSGANARGEPAPEMPSPTRFSADPPAAAKLSDFGVAIITSGFRPDFGRWVKVPTAFDDAGFPIQNHGTSTVVPGLHFIGVHFQRKRSSATLYGVGEKTQRFWPRT